MAKLNKEIIEKGITFTMSCLGLVSLLIAVFKFISNRQSLISLFKSVFIDQAATGFLLLSALALIYILIFQLPQKRPFKKDKISFIIVALGSLVFFAGAACWFWIQTFQKADYGILGYRVERKSDRPEDFSAVLRPKLDSLFSRDPFFKAFKKETDNNYREDISSSSATEDFQYRFYNGLMFYGNYSSVLDNVVVTFKWFDQDSSRKCPFTNDTTMNFDSCRTYYTKNADMIIAFISGFSKFHRCETRGASVKDFEKVLGLIEADPNGYKLYNAKLLSGQFIAEAKKDTSELNKIVVNMTAPVIPDSLAGIIDFYTTSNKVLIRDLDYFDFADLKFVGKSGSSYLAVSETTDRDTMVIYNSGKWEEGDYQKKDDPKKTRTVKDFIPARIAKKDLRSYLLKNYDLSHIYKFVAPEIIVREKQ